MASAKPPFADKKTCQRCVRSILSTIYPVQTHPNLPPQGGKGLLTPRRAHHRRHREVGAFGARGEAVGGAQCIARVAVLSHLRLRIEARDRESNADNAPD